jgi:hypothetical protein
LATSINDRMLFVHVPKTGGVWVSEALACAGVEFTQIVPADMHPTLAELPRSGRFTFGFVREPVYWYSSLWRFHRTAPQHHWPKLGELLDLELVDFLQEVVQRYPGYLTKYFRQFVGSRDDEIDFVGRKEHLVDDLVHALQLAGQDFDERALRSWPQANVSTWLHDPVPDDLAAQLRAAEHEVYERFYVASAHPLVGARTTGTAPG